MQRYLASLVAIPLLLATASAQCFEQSFGVLAPFTGGQAGYGDDVFFDVQPMNFAFPMAGLSATYTHAHVCENGILFLTNGSPTTASTYAYQATPYFVGAAGDDPRIAPLFADLWSDPANGGGVYINNTIPGKFVVTWVNMVEWWATTQPGTPVQFTFQAQLFSTGDVRFYYGPSTYGASYVSQLVTRCGVSQGSGVADPGPVDLTAGNVNLSTLTMYEEFPVGVFDLQDKEVQFVNAGTGYVQLIGSCVPAYHQTYGAGCYNISDSFYQLFADAALAAPALTGQSMVMTPIGSQYYVTWGGGTYVAPPLSAAPVFATATDDGETSLTPSVAFPTPSGPQATLLVNSNGLISWGAGPQTFPGTQSYAPSVLGFLNAGNSALWSWHDYAEQDAGSGRIVSHEAVVGTDTVLYVSWHNVDSWPLGIANTSSMQFQLNLTTGAVTTVWSNIDSDITSAFGSAHLVGWSPGGPSTDDGSQNLATALPLLTNGSNILALSLTASPAPISGTAAGTLLTYTTNNMREVATGAGVYVGLNVLSLTQVVGGLDLGFLGAPGCSAYVGGLDFTQAMVGPSPTNTVNLQLPAGLPSGLQVFSQSISLMPPNSLPGGKNDFGLLVSNGVKTFVSSF